MVRLSLGYLRAGFPRHNDNREQELTWTKTTGLVMQTLTVSSKTATPSSTCHRELQTRHLGMLRLDYLRKMLLYSLLYLLVKAVAANPCVGFALQYCRLRTPNPLLVFAKAFRWEKPNEALFFSFI